MRYKKKNLPLKEKKLENKDEAFRFEREGSKNEEYEKHVMKIRSAQMKFSC